MKGGTLRFSAWLPHKVWKTCPAPEPSAAPLYAEIQPLATSVEHISTMERSPTEVSLYVFNRDGYTTQKAPGTTIDAKVSMVSFE